MSGTESDRLTAPRSERLAALLAGGLSVAASFAVAGTTPAFVAAPVERAVIAVTPGVVMATAIRWLGDLAQTLAFALAVGLSVAGLAAVAFAAIRLGRRSAVPYTGGVAGLVGGWLVAALATGTFVASLVAGGALAATLVVTEREWAVGVDGRPVSASRRTAIATLLAAAGFGGFALFRGRSITGARDGPIAAVTDEETQAAAEAKMANADEQSFDVQGLSGLVTPSDEFYEVDKNSVNPNVSVGRWSLSVTGAVSEELELSYDDLLGMAVEHRFSTLRCVGESVNGHKMDTALWTGVSATDVLDRAGVPENCCVMFRATDDYYGEFPLGALRDGFLAFGMNGELLPRGHGYPLRALVPGHWGEVNVKWLDEIEVLEEPATGFWEKRGWHGTGPVHTVAKLHAVERLGGGRAVVAGHAYAGTRGTRRVEVSTDGGKSWTDADLGPQLPGDAWRQWRFEWSGSGEHEVIVRATDGDGDLQPEEFSKPYPNGPTGWVSQTIEP